MVPTGKRQGFDIASGSYPLQEQIGGTSYMPQWTVTDHNDFSISPNVLWQDTTSNATYSSASSVLDTSVK